MHDEAISTVMDMVPPHGACPAGAAASWPQLPPCAEPVTPAAAFVAAVACQDPEHEQRRSAEAVRGQLQ